MNRRTFLATSAALIESPLTASAAAFDDIALSTSRNFYTDNKVYNDPAGIYPLPISSPESVGLKSSVLLSGDANRGGDSSSTSFLVVKNGKLVHEKYFHGATAGQARNIHSASKSILSCLVGRAIQNGQLTLSTTVNQVLGKKFKVPGTAGTITVENLLTMSSGLRWSEDNTEDSLKGNFAQGILNLGSSFTPGKRFNYSTGDAYLMGVVLQEATGQSIPQMLQAWAGGICYPTKLSRDSAGYWSCCCNFYLSPRKMATFGQLVLDGFSGAVPQAVSKPWITTASTIHKPSNDYGYFWWVDVNLNKHRGFRAWGWGKQMVYVFPLEKLVVVTTCNTNQSNVRDDDLNSFVGNYVIAALA